MAKERWKKINKIAHELGVQEARKESRDCNDFLSAEMLDPLYYLSEAKSLVRELEKDIVSWDYLNEKLRHLNEMKEIVEKSMLHAKITKLIQSMTNGEAMDVMIDQGQDAEFKEQFRPDKTFGEILLVFWDDWTEDGYKLLKVHKSEV